jgi:hypothetical protein
MTGVEKIYSGFERKPDDTGSRQAHASNEKLKPACFNRNRNTLVHLFQPLGIEAKFLGHLDQLLGGFRILDGFGKPPGSVGLISIMVGLGHRSTFLDKCRLRQKGSTSGTRPDVAG